MARLFEKYNKDSIIIYAIFITFIVIVALAVVLGNVKFGDSPLGTVADVLDEGDLTINYIDGSLVSIKDSKEHTYGLSILNRSESKIFYSVYLNDCNVKNADIEITDKEGNLVNKISSNTHSNKLINLYSIKGGETIRYTIKIKSKNRFSGNIKVVNESISTETFSDLILFNNSEQVLQTRLGIDTSTIDEGLISTIDNKGTSYYFRGNIDYNYVKLEDMLFRIVRINGDNSVRLVLDNVLETQLAYNTNTEEEESSENLATLEKASITTYLNSWADSNLASIKKYLSKEDYCTDINFNREVNNIKYSSTYERIYIDKMPDLYCSGKVYSGLVGLLSADEVVMAGGVVGIPNNKYYLYNKDIPGNYVTSSSYFINTSNIVAMINVMSNGALGDGILVNNVTYIRPVINISEKAKVKGSGTIDNPYIIVS